MAVHRSTPDPEDLPWDPGRLPLALDQPATDAAVTTLTDADPQRRVTVRRVCEVCLGDRPASETTGTDWARALAHAGGDVVAITWSSAGWTEVGYRADEELFVIAGYSAIPRADEGHFVQEASQRTASDLLTGRPQAVTIDEATLLARGDA